MQKKLMAVAVAGALAVPAVAIAQSSVTLSGRATFEYGRVDQGPNRPSTDALSAPGGSNVRFRSEENLGGGMSAWFQCESSTDVTGRNSLDHTFCTRNSAVGLRGGFGNAFVGRWDTPMKRALGRGSVGAEETGILGMAPIAFGNSTTTSIGLIGDDAADRHVWKRRETHILQYETPNLSGFQLGAAVTAGSSATAALNTSNNKKPRLWSIGAQYAAGPFEAGLAYERHNDVGTFAQRDMDDKAWGFGISYAFGPVQVGFTYLDADYDTSVVGTQSSKKTYSIGADWRLPGPHMLSIQYVRAKDTTGNGSENIGNVTRCNNVATNCADTGGNAWSLGYTYRLSKRTSARLGYIRINNDSRTNAYRTGPVAGANYPNGENGDGWALLVKHDF